MMDKFEQWVKDNPMMAAGVFAAAGAALTYLVLKFMKKLK